MLLYGALAACATLAALLVYRYDLYEREPWYVLALMAAAGFGAMHVAGWTETWTLDRVRGEPSHALIAIVAATQEEGLRLIAVIVLALVARRQVNDPIDGLIYGSVFGLGMAVAESLDHMRYLPEKPSLLPPSELVRLLGHLVLGGITCFGVGLARLGVRRWPWALLGCAALATTWHFLWDWIAFSAWEAGVMTHWQTAGGIALMLSGLLLYGALVVAGSSRSRSMLAPESARTVWGWPFTPIRK